MYLAISKNKHGLSIEAYGSKDHVTLIADDLKGVVEGVTYHVRKFDLATIDLDKLMESEKEDSCNNCQSGPECRHTHLMPNGQKTCNFYGRK